jgi:hypothetical protein
MEPGRRVSGGISVAGRGTCTVYDPASGKARAIVTRA